jgi:hypothetical protein
MKHLITIFICLCIVSAAHAQNKTANSSTYKTAIGIKAWNGAGANLKTFIDEKNAVEVVGFFITVLHALLPCMNCMVI